MHTPRTALLLLLLIGSTACAHTPDRPEKFHRLECKDLHARSNDANGLIFGGLAGGLAITPFTMLPALLNSANSAENDSSDSTAHLALAGLGVSLAVMAPLITAGHLIAPSEQDWAALGCDLPNTTRP